MAGKSHVVTWRSEIGRENSVSLLLLVDVTNAGDVRNLAIAGKLDVALLKPSLVLDPFQVLVAANVAQDHCSKGKMKTRNIKSELLFCLSTSKNISDSLKKFGCGESDTAILVVAFDDQNEEKMQQAIASVNGNPKPLEEVSNITDITSIKKIYKIDKEELECSSLLDAVVNRISTKDIM